MAHVRLLPFALAVLGCWPGVVWAGMPGAGAVLTRMTQLRLQNISFFLAGFLLSALLIKLLWNYLRRDVPWLPRLSYFRAVGLVGLWGLLFLLVLTMISGARELLTPGAWEPSGVTYRLKNTRPTTAEPPDNTLNDARRQQLARLKDALWQYARAHGGRFPESRTEPAIPGQRWQLPDLSRMEYVYFGGTASALDGVPLACEPEVYGPQRWVLFTDGDVRLMTADEIRRALPEQKKQ
jgi:hypothetical protein